MHNIDFEENSGRTLLNSGSEKNENHRRRDRDLQERKGIPSK